MLEFLSSLTVSAVALALLWFLASVVLLGASIVAVVLLLRLVLRRGSWRALWSGTLNFEELTARGKILGNEIEIVGKLQKEGDTQILEVHKRLKDLEQKHDGLAGVFGHLLEDWSEALKKEEDD